MSLNRVVKNRKDELARRWKVTMTGMEMAPKPYRGKRAQMQGFLSPGCTETSSGMQGLGLF